MGAGVGVPAYGVKVGVGVNIPLPGSVGVWHPGSPEQRIPIASAHERSVPRFRLTDTLYLRDDRPTQLFAAGGAIGDNPDTGEPIAPA